MGDSCNGRLDAVRLHVEFPVGGPVQGEVAGHTRGSVSQPVIVIYGCPGPPA